MKTSPGLDPCHDPSLTRAKSRAPRPSLRRSGTEGSAPQPSRVSQKRLDPRRAVQTQRTARPSRLTRRSSGAGPSPHSASPKARLRGFRMMSRCVGVANSPWQSNGARRRSPDNSNNNLGAPHLTASGTRVCFSQNCLIVLRYSCIILTILYASCEHCRQPRGQLENQVH
jgi:hypothetical protein